MGYYSKGVLQGEMAGNIPSFKNTPSPSMIVGSLGAGGLMVRYRTQNTFLIDTPAHLRHDYNGP
jgi:hypothetical protein